MNKKPTEFKPAPWYKHAWVWFVIALPACGVVASLSVAYIAYQNAPEVISQQNKFRLNSD